jgi:hypothetical protein
MERQRLTPRFVYVTKRANQVLARVIDRHYSLGPSRGRQVLG